MNFKKALAILMATLMCVSLLVACESTDEKESASGSATDATEAETNSSEASTSSETESGTEAESDEKAEIVRFDYFGNDLSKYITLDKSVYSDMSVEISSQYIVDDEDVQTYIQKQRLNNRTALNDGAKVTDKAIELGDSAYIYYKGFLNGEEFEGGSNWDAAEPTELVIGSGSFIPGFEEGLIGIIPADTSKENPYPLNVTFPMDYYENLAGKAVVFNVWIEYAVEHELPEYNEAFITDTLQFTPEGENVKQEFEASVLALLETEVASYRDADILNSIWDILLAEAKILEYPAEELEYYYNSYLDQYEYYMEYYTYFGYSFENLDQFVWAYLGLEEGSDWKAETRESCKIDVAQNMIFHYIAQKENVIITDADYQKSIQYYVDYYTASGYTYTAKEIEDGMGADYLKEHALFEKVNAMLKENCKVSYAD